MVWFVFYLNFEGGRAIINDKNLLIQKLKLNDGPFFE